MKTFRLYRVRIQTGGSMDIPEDEETLETSFWEHTADDEMWFTKEEAAYEWIDGIYSTESREPLGLTRIERLRLIPSIYPGRLMWFTTDDDKPERLLLDCFDVPVPTTAEELCDIIQTAVVSAGNASAPDAEWMGDRY